MSKEKMGKIVWTDLTVSDAGPVRDFYAAVVGWEPSDVDMDGYADFNMNDGEGNPVAGVCHARGSNVGLPAQWLNYVTVADIDASAARCTEMGGELVVPPKSMGSHGRYCVVQDPAGAVIALIQPAG